MPGTEQAILADRLRLAAEPVAAFARLSSGRWSRRVPLSVRLQGGASRITIAAGGQRAPQAYTFEGRDSGAPIAHPVYGHGPREKWTWVRQVPRPFLREAIDATEDQVVEIIAGVIDDWTAELGFHLWSPRA